jgi:selenide,water dikinase
MDSTPIVPIQKQVVLVGAGNAHLRFIKMFGMQPLPGVAVTLVSASPAIAYSAMVPGHIAGDYSLDEITIDLVRLCRAVNVRFIAERASGIDVAKRKVSFDSRAELRYDVLSLGLGSLPACPPGMPCNGMSWPMRPLGILLDHLTLLEKELRQSPRPFHFVVVGGGASGCELALAIHKRFAAAPGFHLTLLQSNAQLLPQFPAKAAQTFALAFRREDITSRVNAQVTGGDEKTLELNGTERLAYDAVLWATNAAPPGLLQSSGLPLNPDGFLQVADTLQSTAEPSVFGTGDCISLVSNPDLPKNGVYAVRQGAILFDNVARYLGEQPLLTFLPQRYCLCLLNTGDSSAALCYGPVVWKGRLARRLKDRIDRAWIDKFTRFEAMTEPAGRQNHDLQMRCGGCGSKISSDVLSAVLKRLDVPDDPRMLLGCKDGEDAAVHRIQPELFGRAPQRLVEVQTVDYFKAFVDDPYLFGRIAAINAVSDLYAMNARPFSALAIATLPYARGPVLEALLYELLSGALHSLRQLGVVLAGGHTTEGSELALGFAVTGYGEEDRLFQKSKLQAGDALILTKPLGSGALLAAWMRGECKAAWFEPLIRTMLVANRHAAEVLERHGVQACTDVTGFGLAGHLLEMLDASKVAACLHPARVPLYEGFAEVVEHGIVSTLHEDNAKVACRVQGAGLVPPPWLFDPQTSGGLLAAVRPDVASAAVKALVEAGYKDTAIIGEVLAGTKTESPLIHIGLSKGSRISRERETRNREST